MLDARQQAQMAAYSQQVMDQHATLARPSYTAGTYGQPLETLTTLTTGLLCLLGSVTGQDIRLFPDLLAQHAEWRVQVPSGTDIRRNDVLTLASGDVLRVQQVLAPQSYTPTITVYASEVR